MAKQTWFKLTVEWVDWPGLPTQCVSSVSDNPESSEKLATSVAAVVLGARETERVWGGPRFGGVDVVEAAARLLVLFAEREAKPGGFWHFLGGEAEADAEAEAGGYGDRLRLRRAVVAAARAYVAGKCGAP